MKTNITVRGRDILIGGVVRGGSTCGDDVMKMNYRHLNFPINHTSYRFPTWEDRTLSLKEFKHIKATDCDLDGR